MTSNDSEPAITIGLTYDCADPAAQARFWTSALGYVEAPPPVGWDTWDAFLADQLVPEDEWNDAAYICDPVGTMPTISFLKVPEPKRTKNRLHLDLKVSGGRHVDPSERTRRIEAKVDGLLSTGGTVYEHYFAGEHLDHVTMLDPEGNEFCVV